MGRGWGDIWECLCIFMKGHMWKESSLRLPFLFFHAGMQT